MTTARKPGRPRGPETDATILRAALAEFVERGVEAMSIEQVARRAGVGKPTIYRRWSTKEELVAQAVEEALVEDVQPSPDDLESMTTRELIDRLLPAAAELVASPEFRALVARVMGSAVSHPSLMDVYWRRYILPRRRQAEMLIRRGQRDGTVAADADPDVLIDMMTGGVTWRVLQPNPPDAAEMLTFLKSVYRQVGLY